VRVNPEDLAYWYMRLNGFLTIRNFVVHPEWRRNGAGTDADIVGVRFPHRQEMQRRPLQDDDWLGSLPGVLVLAIAEVKAGLCNLNGPWINPDQQNVHRVLAAVGLFPDSEIDDVAKGLYANGLHRSGSQVALLLAFGRTENADLSRHHREVRQILWPAVLSFIWHRFSEYWREKAWHQPWDHVGEDLYTLASQTHDAVSFSRGVEIVQQPAGG
jgi:hypothetical protein